MELAMEIGETVVNYNISGGEQWGFVLFLIELDTPERKEFVMVVVVIWHV